MRKTRDTSPSDANTEVIAAASTSFASSTTPAALPGRRSAGPYRVITVYTGSICRSAMAEVALRGRLATAGIPDSRLGSAAIASAGVSDGECGSPTDSQACRVLIETGCGVGANDVSCATSSAIASHAAHRVTDAKIIETGLLLAVTDSHQNILQCRVVGLGVGPNRIHMYRELGPASAPQVETVAAGGPSRSVLNMPSPWYSTTADFLGALEVVERTDDRLAEQLAAFRD